MILAKVLYFFFLIHVSADVEINLIVDYFKYKGASKMDGFTCYSSEDNFSLLRNLNQNNISASLRRLDSITDVHAIAANKFWKMGVFFDTRCCTVDEISFILSEASNRMIFDELRSWLILVPNITDISVILQNRSFGLSTDIIVAIPSEIQNSYELYDVYGTYNNDGGLLNVTSFGFWDPGSQLNMKSTQSKISRRSDLQNMTLKAIFFQSPFRPARMSQEEYLQDSTNRTQEGLTKFGYIMIKLLSNLYNFHLQCVESPIWKKGDTAGPIVRALNANIVDFTGSPMTMNIARTYLLRYVHQDWPFRTCFFFRSPQKQDIKVNEVLDPLTAQVWYLMLSVSTVIIMIFTYILKYENGDALHLRFSNAVLIVIGAICQQGTNLGMVRASTRIVFLCTMGFSFLLYTYYSASVVSARLNQPIFKINDSLFEFGKLQMKMASEWIIYLDFFLKKTDWETQTFYNNTWLKIPEEERYMEPEEGIQLVKEGGFAYHTHPEVAYPFIDSTFDNREICELMEVHLANPTKSTFAVTLNSSFTEIARVGLTKISEVGLRHRHLLKWSHQKPVCRKDVLKVSSTDIYEFGPHLVLLFLGIILSLIIFLTEFFYGNHNARFELDGLLKMLTWRRIHRRKNGI
ncbi:hypothetical protein QAD02_006603 [Eretmocerus hayati]|uniref:Uncharacterized protein n=1 Tax=Eretmocerus hayati TaxID=131215 RepID=A0ACC2N1Q3_9HYME|nr:hypothetical protein QAD02_006603 [Eretmocerus hayati]